MALVNQDAIRDAIAYCVGEGIAIYWDGEAEMPMNTVPYVTTPKGACNIRLSLNSNIQLGEDDQRKVYNAGTDQLDVTVAGNRMSTLSLRIEADQREEAYETAERVRTRLRFATPRGLLRAANISISSIESTQGIDGSWDNRDISVAVLDIRLNIGSNDYDAPLDFIETMDTSATVAGRVNVFDLVLDALFTPVSPGLVKLTGNGFRTGLLCRFDGMDYNTEYVSPREMRIQVPAGPGMFACYLHLGPQQSNTISVTVV